MYKYLICIEIYSYVWISAIINKYVFTIQYVVQLYSAKQKNISQVRAVTNYNLADSCMDDSLRAGLKVKVIFFVARPLRPFPPPPPLELSSHIFWKTFSRELQRSSLFLVSRPLNPNPLLSSRATKKKFFF